MSGIAAIFQRNNRPVARGSIEKMARALKVYGPHRQAIRPMGSIALAYTHFVNSPEALYDEQPLSGGAGRFAMVFDGRLDNRHDLADRLGIARRELPSIPDSALAMRAWEEWQTNAINSWVGEFAVIVWDSSERCLIAAKEQFGRRGLHYHLSDDRLVIASMPKAIHSLGDVPRELDEQKIADALVWMTGEPWRGYFKHLKRVPPAHYLRVNADTSRVVEYYRLEDNIKPIRFSNDGDYVEAAREYLEHSVRAAVRSPGPVGALMSGGLDSSAVAVTAAQCLDDQQEQFPTFTWVPESDWQGAVNPKFHADETTRVKAIAEKCNNIELNFVSSSGKGLDYRQTEFFDASELPLGGINFPPFLLSLERARDQDVRVLLDSQLGDLTLSNNGSGLYLYLWKTGNYYKLLKEIRAGSRTPVDMLRLFYKRVLKPTSFQNVSLSTQSIHQSSSHDFIGFKHSMANQDLMGKMNLKERADQFGYSQNFHPNNKALSQDKITWILRNYFAAETGNENHAIQSLFGLELRDPMANRSLIEWALGIPLDQFRRDGESRYLIKRLMADQLPDAVLNSKTVGLQSADWHKRLSRDRSQILDRIGTFALDEDVANMMDVDKIAHQLTNWQDDETGNSSIENMLKMKQVPFALGLGNYIRWAKRAN